jgi:hypothetical protein
MTIGSAIRLPPIGSVGFWTVGMYFCAAIGLLIGQFFVYSIFKKKIIQA